ncbi:MAG: hypothetical protein QOJ09_2016 [Actinomycetota bacterium]|nr:hypothetical protein [Actinomycetota bacterium]
MRMRALAAPAAALTVSLMLLGACGGGNKTFAGTSGKSVRALPADLVPSKINGLAVSSESVKKTIGGVKKSFVDETSLYSFRTGDTLQATLQISRFSKEAASNEASFHTQVVSKIGSTVPRAFRVGSDTVYLTTGKQQNISIWFRGRYLFVMAVRAEYEQPRTLLRRTLEIKP